MKTYNDGLDAACNLLQKTAADYEEIAQRLRFDYARFPATGLPGHRQKLKQDLEAAEGCARLLRGQVGHITQLKI